MIHNRNAVPTALFAILLGISAQAQSWRFAYMSDHRSSLGHDPGVSTTTVSRLVADMRTNRIDLVLIGGDLIHGDDQPTSNLVTQYEVFKSCLAPLTNMDIPYYAIPGNHEFWSKNMSWSEATNAWWQALGRHMPQNGPTSPCPERGMTYRFDHKNALFMGLNMYTNDPTDTSTINGYKGVDTNWVKTQLAGNTNPHVFVFGHVPPTTIEGTSPYAQNVVDFWNLLATARCSAYFCGHIHNYQRTLTRAPNGAGYLFEVMDGSGMDVVNPCNGPPWWPADNPIAVEHLSDDDTMRGYVLVEVDGLNVSVTRRCFYTNAADEVHWTNMDSFAFTANPGSNLPAPTGVSATYGTYTNRVRVTWNGVAEATSYVILRNTTNDANGATILSNVPAADALRLTPTAHSLQSTVYYYDDNTVVGRQSYYYWVQALCGLGGSALSCVGMGYAELGNGQTVGRSDLTVSDMVFLPVNLTNGSPAGTVSYRLANGGPDTLTAAPVRFDFYMARSNQADWMAYHETNVSLAAGTEQLIILDAPVRNGMQVRGDLAGQYAVQARVRHLDLIGDGHTGSNTTDAAGTVLVRASGVNSPGRSLNDYDGDGKSDVCLYRSALGRWYFKLSGDRYNAAPTLGDFGAGLSPVPGDYDGDGLTDAAVYNRLSSQWLVRFTSSGLLGDFWLGDLEFTAAQCDIDGDAMTDPVVYREADGHWLGSASSRKYVPCDASLGETGYQSVVADYDGDRLADPAVYNRTTGLWLISLSGRSGQVVTAPFGGSGYLPASADYDGDGVADPAIYKPSTGEWQMLLSASLATRGDYTWWGEVFGNINGAPVPADYDGDGLADPAVYHQDTGLWELFRSTQGYKLAWGFFGGPAYAPVTE